MLKDILPVSRGAHAAMKGDNAKLHELLQSAKQRATTAEAERDAAIQSYEVSLALALAQRDAAYQERDEAIGACNRALKKQEQTRALAIRACTQLQGVNTTRSGGAKLRAEREALYADVMLAGLWGEGK
jgi:hypothetical protein